MLNNFLISLEKSSEMNSEIYIFETLFNKENTKCLINDLRDQH